MDRECQYLYGIRSMREECEKTIGRRMREDYFLKVGAVALLHIGLISMDWFFRWALINADLLRLLPKCPMVHVCANGDPVDLNDLPYCAGTCIRLR